MASRALDLHDRRTLIDRVLDDPQLPVVVPRLPPHALHGLILAVGLEDAGGIVAHATAGQLTRIFDEDLWTRASLGDRFDASRFGTWLDVLAGEDPGAAARMLAGLSGEFVVGALSHHILVVERAWVTTGAAFRDPEVSARGRAAIRALLDQGLTAEFGALLVIGVSRHSWDAALAVLRALHSNDEAVLHDILAGCARASFAWLATADGGPTAGHLYVAEMADARDERRDAAGFVTAGDAQAFLAGARSMTLAGPRPERDALTAAYFRQVGCQSDHGLASMPQAGAAAPQSQPATFDEGEQELLRVVLALADAPGPEPRLLVTGRKAHEDQRLGMLAAHFARLHEHNDVLYRACLAEMTYLVNVVAAGASFQSRHPTPHEAREIVLATCNLGLENWPRHWDDGAPPQPQVDLVTVFAVGWTMLHERVAVASARRLCDVLADIRIEDRSLALQLAETRARLERSIAGGRPWQIQPHLDVISILDQVSWFVVSALVDECPAIPSSLYETSSSPALRVTPDLEFVSANAQIAWVKQFLASLPERLIG